MSFLLDMWDLFHWFLTWGPDLPADVIVAPIPIWAGLAAGAALGGANYLLGGKQRRRLRDRAQRIDEQRADAARGFNQQIESVLGRAEEIDTSPEFTADELYGESIQTALDRVSGGQAQAGRQLSRAVMAGGGDLTGAISTQLQNLASQSNKSIQDIMTEYNERVDRRNLQERQRREGRQDALIQSALGARGNQMSVLSNLSEQAFNRSAQKATADKQFIFDALGMGANVASIGRGFGAAGAGGG